MAREIRPKDYPKLKNYQPTRFMLPTSCYDKKKLIEQLPLLKIFATQKVNGLGRDSGYCPGKSN